MPALDAGALVREGAALSASGGDGCNPRLRVEPWSSAYRRELGGASPELVTSVSSMRRSTGLTRW
jgi:hypothetical protein